MVRKTIAVLAGYLVFAVSAFAYFQLAGVDPHASPTLLFAVVTSVYGLLFSFVGGCVLQLIAKTENLKPNLVLAFVIAGFAFFSLIMTHGNHWTQIVSILVYAPISVLGGGYSIKRRK